MDYPLEIVVNKTQAGLFTVSYVYKNAPLHFQEAAFVANGFDIVSLAQLGFLQAMQKECDTTFNRYSDTRADVLYDDRTGKIVIVPDGAISRVFGVANLVSAHYRGKEYVIPTLQRDLVYAMVDEMLKNGIAFTAPNGTTQIKTSEFGENGLTSKLFSDNNLGIKAQGYGDWLRSLGISNIAFHMGGEEYSRAQKAPYLNRLRVFGPDFNFVVYGLDWLLVGYGDCAFGVRFEKTAKGGAKEL